jgi:hypothetical protein
MAHDLVLYLDKLSTQLIYLLSQEGNWIRSTATGSLSHFCFLDTRILKRIYPRFKEIFFNLDIVLFVFAKEVGFFSFIIKKNFPSKAFK